MAGAMADWMRNAVAVKDAILSVYKANSGWETFHVYPRPAAAPSNPDNFIISSSLLSPSFLYRTPDFNQSFQI